tara:strand:+ start:7351 stop:7656 length:306 start_codon:yes stop_codon:yes gene_type:complete
MFIISVEAYAEFKTITKKEFLDANLKILEKRFNQIDTNNDKKIDSKENKAWRAKVIKARQERAKKLKKKSQELAKKIDTNKDGKITKKELEDYKKKLKSKK